MTRVKIPNEVDGGHPLYVPASPKAEDLVAIIDTREQLRLPLPMKWVLGTLHTGDYSLVGLERFVRIERKNFEDFLGCVGRGRIRFDKEIERLRAFQTSVLLIEGTWEMLESGEWPEYVDRQGEIKKSKVKPQAAYGSVLGWIAHGINVHLVGVMKTPPADPDELTEFEPGLDVGATRERAAKHVARILFYAARRHFEDVRRCMTGRMLPWMVPEEEPGPPEDFT